MPSRAAQITLSLIALATALAACGPSGTSTDPINIPDTQVPSATHTPVPSDTPTATFTPSPTPIPEVSYRIRYNFLDNSYTRGKEIWEYHDFNFDYLNPEITKVTLGFNDVLSTRTVDQYGAKFSIPVGDIRNQLITFTVKAYDDEELVGISTIPNYYLLRLDNRDDIVTEIPESIKDAEYLYIENRIDDLELLSSLENLKYLVINYSESYDYSALSNLVNVEHLIIGRTKGRINDLSFTESMSNLVSLYNLTSTGIWDFSFLESLPKLEYLSLRGGANIYDSSPLSYLTNLRYLDLAHTPVTKLEGLENLSNLEYLFLIRSSINNIDSVKNLVSLKEISLFLSDVSDISALGYCTNLEVINVATTSVSDISSLSTLINLKSLNLFETKVVDLTPLDHLEGISISQ
jgi:hypothetical protein